jgi:hypothetical protein
MTGRSVMAAISLPTPGRRAVQGGNQELKSTESDLHLLNHADFAGGELSTFALPDCDFVAISFFDDRPEDNLIDYARDFLTDRPERTCCTVPVRCVGIFPGTWRMVPTAAQIFLEIAPPFLMIKKDVLSALNNVVLDLRRLDPLADLALRLLASGNEIRLLETPLIQRETKLPLITSDTSFRTRRTADLSENNAALWKASCHELMLHQVIRFHQANDSLTALEKRYAHLGRMLNQRVEKISASQSEAL